MICKMLVKGRNVFAPAEGVLAQALGAGPCDAPTLVGRMYRAGWRPRRRPEEPVHGLQNSMQHRMDWRCRRGMAAKLLVGSRNVYVSAEAAAEVAKQFDLSDPAARLVAADWLEERGRGEVAALLRRARRWTFGRLAQGAAGHGPVCGPGRHRGRQRNQGGCATSGRLRFFPPPGRRG